VINETLYRQIRDEELALIRERIGEEEWNRGYVSRAAELFDRLTLSEQLEDFLTVPAYEEVLADEFGELFERSVNS